MLELVSDRLGFSARTYKRILKVPALLLFVDGSTSIHEQQSPRRSSTAAWIGRRLE